MITNNRQATAKLNYLRIAPRKTRAVARTIKGLSVNDAQAQLLFQKRRPAKPILKLLRSAIANAKNKQLNEERLGIVDIRVDQGPRFKRYMPRARGSASMIEKKSSHITLVLEESDKFQSRFRTLPIKTQKEKKAEKKHKKEKPAAPRPTMEKTAPKLEKPGFFRRVFRRKAI